jgi:mRNA interferase MazF
MSVPLNRGEVWLFDCGMVEKVRPVLIFSVPFADTDRAVVSVVFHSTALRVSQFEVQVQVPFLKDGAFIAQSIATYPTVRAIRKLGALNATQLAKVEFAVFKWLGRVA